jgi:glucose-1-phosphate cytidylyltransferase
MGFEDVAEIPVVILCGGAGTRIKEETETIPKPMVTVGGKPILWHLMNYYASFGFSKFILCLGYKADVIKNYVLNLAYLSNSFTVHHGQAPMIDSGGRDIAGTWDISCVDTGENAMTGARVKRVQPFVGHRRFMLTYGDGLSDVDLHALLRAHIESGRLTTVTGVHPPSRFGLLTLDGTRVRRFAEKPHTQADYINGGFFVCEPGVFQYLEDDDLCVLERTPLERMAADGQMQAYLHEDYWQCMDTMRDRELLEEAWQLGAPWKRW